MIGRHLISRAEVPWVFTPQIFYSALGKSGKTADSVAFVELMLEIILDTLRETSVVGNPEDGNPGINPHIRKLLDTLGDEELSAVEIMRRLGLSHRPTFRKNYLNPALEQGYVEMSIPDKSNSQNQKCKKR